MGGRIMTTTCPADSCPACLTIEFSVAAEPYFTQPEGAGSILAHYRCGRCGHFWRTSWLATAIAETPADPAAGMPAA
jgi:hypothetical protein